MDAPPLTGVAVLGSTGSIGTQALDVLAGLGERFRVVGLTAGRNAALLHEQIQTWKPKLVCCQSELDGDLLATAGARIATPEEIACDPDVDVVLVGTSGTAGLSPTLAALKAGKAVALANKEVLVMAGAVVRATADASAGSLRPVDSEHSAIWQCLWGEEPRHVERLILTASGGALRDRPLADLPRVTPDEVLRHPTWVMGRKITVDCATLLNKGLEMIEASWLFDVPIERVDVVMHRESIVHSLVELSDGSVKAQLGLPDMRLPIQLALTYPRRLPVHGTRPLRLGEVGALHFQPLDLERVPCLGLAIEAARRGGTYPAVLSAADEVAVARFLDGRLGFTEIAHVVEGTLAGHTPAGQADLDAILDADAWARRYAEALARRAEERAAAAR